MCAEIRFRRACDQVTVINRKIRSLEVRYFKARADHRRSYRYILRMRLMSAENMRDMYHIYAAAKADEVMALRKQLGTEWEEQEDDVADFVDNNITDSEDEEMEIENNTPEAMIVQTSTEQPSWRHVDMQVRSLSHTHMDTWSPRQLRNTSSFGFLVT